LEKIAGQQFVVTSLRFATACGMSERLRLDLVLNDFVACAVASKKITILSDGTPWRPLINIKDMARAIDWAIKRELIGGGEFLAVNTGSDEWNYQVKDLAEAVAKVIPGIDISINKNAQPDKRSYRVSFELFKKLAPDFQPEVDLITTIRELKSGLEAMKFKDEDFRNSQYMRLKVLTYLRNKGLLTEKLEWADNRLL
jgi:nucleoside-diphosphate-sugar epimerase